MSKAINTHTRSLAILGLTSTLTAACLTPAHATVTARLGDVSRTVVTGPGAHQGQLAIHDKGELFGISFTAAPRPTAGGVPLYTISYAGDGIQQFSPTGQPVSVRYTSLRYDFNMYRGTVAGRAPTIGRDAAGNTVILNGQAAVRLGSGSLINGSFTFGPDPTGYAVSGLLRATFTPTSSGTYVFGVLAGTNTLDVNIRNNANTISQRADGAWITDPDGLTTASFYTGTTPPRLAAAGGADMSAMASYGEPVQNVPEPASLAILGAGLLGLGMTVRRKAATA